MGEKVTIGIKAFPYYEDATDPVTGNTIRQERIARRGDEVELSKEDLERAKRFNALQTSDSESSPSSGGEPLDIDAASVEELSAWIQEDKPSVNEVIEAADGDPELASKLLDAENHATGNDPRKGVVEGLTRVAQG